MKFIKLLKTAVRMTAKRKKWQYDSAGYCPSCNSKTLFISSLDQKNGLLNYTNNSMLSNTFSESLLERENNFCIYCSANYRMRVHAETVLKILHLPSANDLLQRLHSDSHFAIYETAAYNIFRNTELRRLPNYVISEYFETAPFGTFVNGIRNENLEGLTFSDSRFDMLINSDVLEHVHDLDKALSEIKRVLKPGGYHVFTIPVDEELRTSRTRTRVVNGRLEHLLEPVMHGDSIRSDGILALRDFGGDVLDYVSREGFACKEYRYYKNNKYVTSVYYAQKR
jgi:SAM-dependent methyltransferase